MATIRHSLLLLLVQSFARGLIIRRKTEDFPLADCTRDRIDVLFIADAGTLNPETLGADHYRRQMSFFAQLVDVFLSASEKNLNRVKFAMLVSTVDGKAPSYLPRISKRFDFNTYSTPDKLKDAIRNDDISPVPISFPISVALYAMDFFNVTGNGARQDTQQIAVMVVNGGKPLQINLSDDMRSFNSTSVKLLVVLVGSESGVLIMSIFPSNNLVEVTSFVDLMQNQMIPIMLCLRCHSDWFRFKALRDTESISNISCYRIFYSSRDINWVQAAEGCMAVESDLVSIETKEELSFLREVTPSKLHEVMNHTGDNNDSTDVFIGLKRDIASYSQRFRWVNDLPLAYNAWNGGEPLGGHIQGCTLWTFNVSVYTENVADETITSARDAIQNRTEYWTERDAWYSIGCGYKKGRFYLCESKKSPSFRDGRMPRAGKTSDRKIRAAVGRGELGLRTEFSEVYGFVPSLVAAASVVRSTDNPVTYSVFMNHEYENRISSNSLIVFQCNDVAHTALSYSLVCDYIPHCQNKRDESVCNYRKCDSMSEFTCKSGQCVPLDAQCDLFPDCFDGSDEERCLKCRHGLCHDGRCLPKHWFSDGEVDCNACTSRGDVKAELASVPDVNISQCLFTCNRTQCVYTSMMNDGYVDCQGPEGPLDETLGKLEPISCYSKADNVTNVFANWAPRCVYIRDRYDGLLGCRDFIHLQNCENFICPEGYIKCPRSYCIPIHYVSNGVYDCADGEDETAPIECVGNFKCSSSKVCLHPDNVCDKHPHCPLGDDELNCLVSCADGFQCIAGVVTVSDYDRSIPLPDLNFIDPRTRYIDMSGVNISLVFPEFPKGRFYNTLELHLSKCAITHVDSALYSQNDLWSVMAADLSYNQIERIAITNIFRYMINLKTLNLSHNEFLTWLHPDSFNVYGTASLLTYLDLSYTNISSLHESLLAPLVNLEYLSLRGTKITHLVPNMFPDDYSLKVLDLRELVIKTFSGETFRYMSVKINLYTDVFKLCCPQLHSAVTPPHVCKSPPDPFSSCSDLMGQQILRVLLWVFGCLAVTGNVVVIVYRLACDRNILRMAYGHFVMHLSISDLFMGVYLLIIAVADSHFKGTYVWNEMEWRNSVACRVAGFLSTLSSEVSTLFIFLITVDRFLVIKFPFGQLKMRMPITIFFCVLCWVLGLGISIIPLLPQFRHWGTYTSNGMCLGLPLINNRPPGWEFPTAIFIFLNFFLFILIVIGQLIIYRTMSMMRMSHGSFTNVNSRLAQDFAVARHLSFIAITDFLCWFPIGVMGLMALNGHHLGPDAYAWSTVLVLPINAAINPIIYTIPALTQKWTKFMHKKSREDTSRNGTRTND